ncbi:unnamed protein product, partial [Amoebophrya sp. A120]|eukprot:GSA120T00023906001.1
MDHAAAGPADFDETCSVRTNADIRRWREVELTRTPVVDTTERTSSSQHNASNNAGQQLNSNSRTLSAAEQYQQNLGLQTNSSSSSSSTRRTGSTGSNHVVNKNTTAGGSTGSSGSNTAGGANQQYSSPNPHDRGGNSGNQMNSDPKTEIVKPVERSGASGVVYGRYLWLYGGYNGSRGGRLDDLFRFDLEKRRWQRIIPKGDKKPMARENNGALVVRGKMYIFGGYSGFTWLNDFWCFDFKTKIWDRVEGGDIGHVPSLRFGYVSAQYKDQTIFIFGGYDGSTWLNDMYEFSFEPSKKSSANIQNSAPPNLQTSAAVSAAAGGSPTLQGNSPTLSSNTTNPPPVPLQPLKYREWLKTQQEGNIPTGRSCPAWATHQESFYLFGGYDGVHRLNDFYQFRMPNRTWTAIRSCGHVPASRYFHSAVVYGDSLFVFGGYSGHDRLNDLYEFRFDIHTWFAVHAEDPPTGRSSLVAAVSNNSLYVFGGYNGSSVLNDFYEFRFEPVTIPPSHLVEDLRSIVNNPILGDVTFLVEDMPVYATRSHLAARSDHFRALFYGGMRETIRPNEPIPIPDVSYEAFVTLLEYLYTDIIPDHLSTDTAVELLISAERYLLQRLKALCEDLIRKGIGFDNVVPILLTAKKHRADGLKDMCMDFIVANEAKMKQHETFKDLTEEPMLLYDLLMRRKAQEEKLVNSMSGHQNRSDLSALSPGNGSSLYSGYSTPDHSPLPFHARPRVSGVANRAGQMLENFLGVGGGGGGSNDR